MTTNKMGTDVIKSITFVTTDIKSGKKLFGKKALISQFYANFTQIYCKKNVLLCPVCFNLLISLLTGHCGASKVIKCTLPA